MDDHSERSGQFSVDSQAAGGQVTIALTGELDIATADQLSAAVEAAVLGPDGRLVIDLTGVGFMDSTGLRVLIAASKRAEQAGSEYVIVTGDSPAKRVLELTRMDEHMRVVATLS